MSEKLLQYIWQQRLFHTEGMLTTKGEPVEVVNPGRLNTDSGPDFFYAQIRIGSTLWAGNVEVHVNADDWYLHGHNHDKAYDNVILHVVLAVSDRPVLTSNGREVSQVILRYSPDIATHYDELMLASKPIRCSSQLCSISKLDRDAWIDRLILERFEERNERVEALWKSAGGDVEQVFFSLLCRAMGFVVNSHPMEILASVTPVKILLKHSDPLQMEALLLGQAGLLTDCDDSDEYIKDLKREYAFLKAKFNLSPMDASLWKMMRLRPDNFPAIRLSQLAAIIRRTPGNFESAFRTMDIPSILSRLDVSASSYWDCHYALGKISKVSRRKSIGLASRRLIVINAVIPFLFAYARRYNKEHEQANVMAMLSFLPVEKNSRLDEWKASGISVQNESEAQALLLLYKNYCMERKCLFCRWGHQLLSLHK